LEGKPDMIRIGTCSWAEKTLIASGEFYTQKSASAEERLKYYASFFDTVEVDSTYYALPAASTTKLWSERTPDNFIFHIKAYGALTGHGIDPKTLPKDLREALPTAEKEKSTTYLKEPELLRAVSGRFVESLVPLQTTGKLGLIVFQFPPWFAYRTSNLDFVLGCRERMGDLPLAVEFRHGSWLTAARAATVFAFLRENGITHITADEPQYGSLVTVPFIPEATTGIAYFRLHGRNRETWLKRGIETSLRYAYLYSDDELVELAAPAKALNAKTRMTFVMFNNCHGGFAVRNAIRMKELLGNDSNN
jgi:uncharacterized protein YecE (DUF72 family)